MRAAISAGTPKDEHLTAVQRMEPINMESLMATAMCAAMCLLLNACPTNPVECINRNSSYLPTCLPACLPPRLSSKTVLQETAACGRLLPPLSLLALAAAAPLAAAILPSNVAARVQQLPCRIVDVREAGRAQQDAAVPPADHHTDVACIHHLQ